MIAHWHLDFLVDVLILLRLLFLYMGERIEAAAHSARSRRLIGDVIGYARLRIRKPSYSDQMRILWTRAFLLLSAVPARFLLAVIIALMVTTAATHTQSEAPKGFLHCIGRAADNKATEHTITIYSKTAIMDYREYTLYSDDAHYALQADQPSLDMPAGSHGIVIIAINRLTGSYEISDGPTIVQGVKIEKGTCTKMDRQL